MEDNLLALSFCGCHVEGMYSPTHGPPTDYSSVVGYQNCRWDGPSMAGMLWLEQLTMPADVSVRSCFCKKSSVCWEARDGGARDQQRLPRCYKPWGHQWCVWPRPPLSTGDPCSWHFTPCYSLVMFCEYAYLGLSFACLWRLCIVEIPQSVAKALTCISDAELHSHRAIPKGRTQRVCQFLSMPDKQGITLPRNYFSIVPRLTAHCGDMVSAAMTGIPCMCLALQ